MGISTGSALAQESTAAAAEEKPVALEEIVVKAQRREERLQDVPIAVTAISGATALSQGVVDSNSFNGMVPSLITIAQGPQQLFFIRGVGTQVAAPNGEQSVAVYIDGVYIYAPVGNMFPVGADIDHIEVLKGPQGTLFGRNATAGVIQVFTKDPSQDAGGQVSLGYGNYNTVSTDFYGTMGLTSDLAANLSVYEKHMGQGYGVDTFDGSPTYKSDQTSVKSKWLWTPADGTELRGVLSFTRVTGDNFDGQIVPGHPMLDGMISNSLPYNTDSSGANKFDANAFAASIQADQEFAIGKLEDIFSFRDLPRALFRTDNTFTPDAEVNVNTYEPSKVFTEELRMLSPDSSMINWVGGVYYIHADTGLEPLYIEGSAIGPPPAAINEIDTQTLWAIAGYSQATVQVLPDTHFTAGVRYNHEHVATSGTTVASPVFPTSPCGPPCGGDTLVSPIPEASEYNNVSWRASLDRKWTPDIMSYISANRSFKSGGFNLAALPGTVLPPFLPEELTAYEIGVKSELLNHQLRFNIAGYHYDYVNIQVQVGLPAGQVTLNGPSAHYNGFDADFVAAITDNFTISGGVNHVIGRYGQYPGAIGYPAQASLGSFTFDATGKTAINAPTWAGNLSADYTIPSAVGQFALNANLSARTQVYVAVTNRLTNPGYGVENDSVSWTHPGGRFSVRLWVLNAFDKEYYNIRAESGVGDYQVFAPPRTYGITGTMKFGANK
jgi:iron complex outermembrane recepter protein